MKRLGIIGAITLGLALLAWGIFGRANQPSLPNTKVKEANPSFLESFYRNKTDYEEAFAKVTGSVKETVFAGIISHHFLAKDLIATFFAGIEPSSVEKVFIAGPDHFQRLADKEYDIATSLLDWQTPYGIFYANQPAINHLLGNPVVDSNDKIFRNEHSIYTLIPFAKKAFPQAKVVPLILKNSQSYQQFFNLGKQISQEKSLLIVSSDFSHQVTALQAKENDLKSIEALTKMNIENLDNVTSDCKQCLAFLYGFIWGKSARFKLVDNKTSQDFGSQDKNNLTSYVSGYFIADDIKILFGGDFMFDRYIRQVANSKGNDFVLQNIAGFLQDKDLVVINLEGPITSFNSISTGTEMGVKNNFVFTFDRSIVETLSKHNIKLVNIGNNHILNFGQTGLNQTKQLLLSENINYFGNTGINDNSARYSLVELKGKQIAFVNYNQFVKEGLEKALNDIKQLGRQADLIVVYTHWGEEYTKNIASSTRKAAHQLIENGADLIIGSHPHVIQEKEVYQGKTIYYSLGNFVFDQYFLEETQKGMLVEMIISLDSDEIKFSEHPVILLQNGQTVLAS